MVSQRDTHLFNLKAVVTATGLKPDTLRAWERRYGIPAPVRTPSGHRLYSQRDIDLLHWLIARQSEGLAISRAVEMWLRLDREASAPPVAPLVLQPSTAVDQQNMAATHDSILREKRTQWIDACLRFDEQAAEQTLSESFALFTPEIVYLDVIQKGLAIIGEGWYKARVTVQQEHFASALALRRLEAMLVATPPPTRNGRILIGCPPEEEHTFVPLLLSLLLRRRGWDTVYLGANVPVGSLEATIAATRPLLVVLTAQQLSTTLGLLEVANVLLRERIPLAYGGLIFNRLPDLQQAIPGHFLGARIEAAAATIEALMAAPRLQAAQRIPSYAYSAALREYRARHAAVEAEVWRLMPTDVMPLRMLAAANLHFGRNIEAALALGDLEYVSADLEWLNGMLVNHVGMPPERVDLYLMTYLQAMRTVTHEDAAPLTRWLSALTSESPSLGAPGHLVHRSNVLRSHPEL